jgi:hypothetical protein
MYVWGVSKDDSATLDLLLLQSVHRLVLKDIRVGFVKSCSSTCEQDLNGVVIIIHIIQYKTVV